MEVFLIKSKYNKILCKNCKEKSLKHYERRRKGSFLFLNCSLCLNGFLNIFRRTIIHGKFLSHLDEGRYPSSP